jgi:hypothetical protein
VLTPHAGDYIISPGRSYRSTAAEESVLNPWNSMNTWLKTQKNLPYHQGNSMEKNEGPILLRGHSLIHMPPPNKQSRKAGDRIGDRLIE